MRVLVAPQEFKGSLTAAEAAHAIAAGIRDARPEAEIEELPMSDGGPGLVEAMLTALGGELIESPVRDPLMRPIVARWGLLASGVAAIEMAAASGLVLLAPDEREPLVATTYGTGELILAALERGRREIIVGVGGSATVDGGAGAVQALGARLLDADGHELPPGGAALARLHRIDHSMLDQRLVAVRIRVSTDVTNPLCGPVGAAVMFGPQKGASPESVVVLEAALLHFAEIVERDCHLPILDLVGGGAAGGLAAGLAGIAGASVEPGFRLVAETVGLEAKIATADLVVTGEGRLDAQTSYGKTASGVAALARKHEKRVAVMAGSVDPSYVSDGEFDVIESVLQPGMSVEGAMHDASNLLRAAAGRAMRAIT